jgi:hypothetical protein
MEYNLDKQDSIDRECDSCTKCCEGHLTATVRGNKMYPGKPCIFVEIGKGCKEYNKRPKDPCKSFSCTWKILKEMPEDFKPDKSGVIFTYRTTDDLKINYMKIHAAPNNPSPEILTWAFLHVVKNKYNLVWEIDDKVYYYGSIDFCSEMKPLYG